MPLSLRLGSRHLVAGWAWLALTLSGAVLFAYLGLWQWHRAGEKRQLQQAFQSGAAAARPLDDHSIASLPRYAQLRVAGQFDPAHQFLLDNISRDGHAGYEVLTPLRLEDGRTLLVNRGWLPLSGGGRSALPDIALTTSGALAVTGRIDELPATGLEAGRAPPTRDTLWPKLTSFPHMRELSAALGTELEPRQLLLSSDAPDGYRRDWQPANAGFGPERHIAYAVQWWSLGALAVVLFFVVNLKRSHR